MKTSVLIVDDHPFLRSGVRQSIERLADVTVVGEAASGAEALQLAERFRPDLILLDVGLPDGNGTTFISRLLELSPTGKVIILSGEYSRELVDAAVEAGASGYVFKATAMNELTKAIEMVLSGQMFLSPEISALILEDYRETLDHSTPAKPNLTERDKELLRLIAAGKRNKEIATILEVQTKSVETFRSRLMKKLSCASPGELVRYAIREGIVTA